MERTIYSSANIISRYLKKLDELGKNYVQYCGNFPGLHCFHLFYKTSESKGMYIAAKKYLMDLVRGVDEFVSVADR